MACTIVIQDVRGVVPVGQSEITILRIVGDAPGCPQVEISSMALGVGPTTVTVVADQFHADLPITVTPKPNCSDPFDISVMCTSGECDQIVPGILLGCCFVSVTSVQGLTPGHAILPTGIEVQREAHGCATVGTPPKARVSVSASTTTGVPVGTAVVDVDDITSTFSAVIPVGPANPVVCGQDIAVVASCDSGTPCASQPATLLGA